jgi:hypothetical protein
MNALSKLNNLKYSAIRIEAFGWLKKILPSVLLILSLSTIALAQSVPLAPAQLDQLIADCSVPRPSTCPNTDRVEVLGRNSRGRDLGKSAYLSHW